jgi:hypothetical protein
VRANIRRWSVRRWAVAAPVAVAVALTVAGCGQTQLGAAALYRSQQKTAGPYSGQRVSSTTLGAEVNNLTAAYDHYKGKVHIPYKPPAMPGKVLTWILRFATMRQVAARNGIHVTPEQAELALNGEAKAAQQSGDSLREVAVLNGLPPDMLSQLGEWFAIQQKLVKRLDGGVAPTTSAGQAALEAMFSHQQCLAAKSMLIRVNPQFGAYNYSQLAVVPAADTLSSPTVISKTSSAHLTPNC